MTSYHHGLPTSLDYSGLLDATADKDLATPTRSTVPHLAYWKERGQRLEDLAAIVRGPQTAQLCFEYPTKSLRGRRASMTDLMILTDVVAVAVEAKWTESRYDTVGKWLPTTKTGADVLRHWLDLVAPYAEPTEPDAVRDCVYQMIHRTASACAQKREQAHVVYQVFESPESKYDPAPDLANLKAVLRPTDRLSFWVHRVAVQPTQAHRDLVAEGSGEVEERAQRTRAALVSDVPLFEFEPRAPIRV